MIPAVGAYKPIENQVRKRVSGVPLFTIGTSEKKDQASKSPNRQSTTKKRTQSDMVEAQWSLDPNLTAIAND